MGAINQVMLMIKPGATPGSTWSYRGNLGASYPTGLYQAFSVEYSPELALYALGAGVGAAGAVIMTSPDGINWTDQSAFSGLFGGAAHAICWNGTKFVCSSNSSNKFATSTNGTTWTISTGTISGAPTIAWDGTKFVAGAVNGTTSRSSDGVTWTASAVITSWGNNFVRSIVWNGSYFLAVGDASRAATSSDGITWVSRTSGMTAITGGSNIVAAAWNGSTWLAASNNTGVKVVTSPDGITWTSRSANLTATPWGNTLVTAIMWDGTNFIAGGTNGQLAFSPDGINWTYSSALLDATVAASGSGFSAVLDFAYKNTEPKQYVAISNGARKNAGTSV